MRRVLSIFLTLILVMALALPGASAAGTPTVSITSGEVEAGGEVTLTVSITDNPGIAATRLYIYFDTSVFDVDPSFDVYLVGTFEKDGGMIGNSIANGKKSSLYDGDPAKDGVLVLWYNKSGINTTADGAMLEIVLIAKENAVNGTYAVELGYSASDSCSESGEKIKFSTGSGTVTVTGGVDADPGVGTTPETGGDPATPADPAVPIPGQTPGGGESTPAFTDISGSWAEEYILRASASGLVNGYPDGTYGPGKTMTRAEFVTILWRASGSPKPAAPATFTDLTQNWYKDAVAWAQANNVVNGVGDNRFDPSGTVTREQIAAILHRMAGSPTGMEIAFTGIYNDFFADSGKVSGWAKPSLYWALYNEIYCGEKTVKLVEGDLLAPGNAADRAQIAVMIIRYLDKVGGNI